ncbi:MAG: type II secretion system protein GspM [Thiobacillus sp.]|nr:type II secretion system protein GspM [Thiobacillus sp.]MDP2057621.1 type II secretion system protein GspM [Thiobacillus sp.]
MKLTLTPMQSRVLAIALLLAVLVFLVVLVYLPWQQAHRHYDTAIEDRLDRTARYLRIAAQRENIKANIALIRQRNASRHYLRASAPALAAAEVQQMAQAIIEANALQVESTQIAAHKDDGLRRKIAVNFRLRGPLPAVQKTLHELETTLPYLYVDNLVVRSSVGRAFTPTPGVQPDVLVQFDLYAFARVASPALKKP